MSADQVLSLTRAVGAAEFVTFPTRYNAGNTVEVEITARQKSDPAPGPSGIYVVWDVCRGVAEVNPVLPHVGYVARHQFVVVVEGRESASGGAWYVCEASDVQTNNKFLMGTGKTIREAFENFCERSETLLSERPEDVERARSYGTVEEMGLMREQALRCFRKAD
jgi:hypothetical protein